MIRLVLNRLEKLNDRTLGRLIVFDGLKIVGTFTTLELPFRNNEKNKSCILSAFYTVEPRTSPKYGKHLIVNGATPRELILLHHGNYPRDTEGCIIVGSDFGDIDKDGRPEVTASKTAMKKLVALVTERAELIIL
ncbi:MAG: DUF5675 family protein [Candidatus Riflebacteria bacterium]|nr:DUF5675 family protein [Candidatus Riflebacteria bacterium]